MGCTIYTIAESYDQKFMGSTQLFLLSYSLLCLAVNVWNDRDEAVALTHHCILQRLLHLCGAGR